MTAPRLAPAMLTRPRDPAGAVLPWFVHVGDDGTPDYRLARHGAVNDALQFELCWFCGTRRGRWATFLAPPVPWPALRQAALDPPAHQLCALWAARALPFITTPGQPRTPHYPGVTVLASTRSWRPIGVGDFVRFELGTLTEVRWFVGGVETPAAEARQVVRDEAARWQFEVDIAEAEAEVGGTDQ